MTRTAALLLSLCLIGPAAAQDAKASREREALRRAQAALREAQAQQAGLQADKAALERDKAAAAAALQAAQAEAAAARGEEQQLARQLADLKRERVDDERRGAEAQRSAAEQARARDDAAGQQIAALRREIAERTQAVGGVGQLLERTTQALADEKARNARLHAIGSELLSRWQDKTCAEITLQAEPLLGFGAVRAGNEAEALRARLDAQRTPAR